MPNQNKVFLFLFLFNQLSEYDLDCLCSRSYFNSEKCNFPDGIRSRDISVASQTNALPTELMEISTDAKWNIHIENILWSIYKHLNVLRKLKYKLSRKNLEKLYLVYIRPIFEYASEEWDNCGVGNSNKLDQLQLEAARIVTGLPIFASSILIYKELGWESLTERRKRRKLQMFYNIQNNNAPRYLCDLIPPTIQSIPFIHCVMEVI